MIFKTIDSSVDSSRKVLALFSKDWNTYKTNFTNASGGFKNKFATIFISNDLNCLKEYNKQVKDGIKPSVAYKNTMMNCTKETKQNAVAMAKGATTIADVEISQKSATASTIDEISIEYAELAQGVDNLGRNVSLNTEEYSRYNEIVNQIVQIFPQMVQGYIDEGNAIIINKGNVKELTKAYQDQKKAFKIY